MRRGIYFSLLSAFLMAGLAIGAIVTAFTRPHVARKWLAQLRAPQTWFSRPRNNAEIVALANHGVVTIIATSASNDAANKNPNDSNQGVQRGTGTGFVIDAAGFIVTNEHVIRGAERIRVKLPDGRELTATVHGTDAATDLALLKIETDQLTPLQFGDSDEVRVGDSVLAIGNPLEYEHSVTAGIVSAKGRKVYYNEPYEDFIQTDAAINRGNSGGPLLNQLGEVIGVNTVIRIDSRGISFAIPSNVARRVIAQLYAQRAVVRGYLGLTPLTLTNEFREGLQLGEQHGVLVAEVAEQTPAAKAGLQAYDVLTQFDGTALNTADDFYAQVANTPPSKQVTLGVWRNGQAMTLTATLGERPRVENERASERPASLVKDRSALGFTVKAAADASGVEVADLDPLGPAAESGLAVGQIILEANRQPVASLESFQKLTSNTQPGQVVILRMKASGETGARLVAICAGQ